MKCLYFTGTAEKLSPLEWCDQRDVSLIGLLDSIRRDTYKSYKKNQYRKTPLVRNKFRKEWKARKQEKYSI
jgi:hypothetical protein